MAEAFRDEVVEIMSLVKAATLPPDIRDTVVWCIGQLPALYDKFCQTYESRYAEEILRLEQGILEKLAEFCSSRPDTQPFGQAVLERLRLLNERYSLPGLVPKTPRAARVRSRKKAS
jgi:hypothetical protein